MKDHTARRVLEGVPRVAFYGDMVKSGAQGCPEDIPLPACLKSLAEYRGLEWLGCRHRNSAPLGSPFACAYAYFMAVCGQGFSHIWNRSEWDPANASALYLTDEALDPVRWALESIGYRAEALGNAGVDRERLFPEHADRASMLERIRSSIDTGMPVLGFGVVGPSECCLIAGYDDEGEVLIGWSFFQGFPEFSPGLEFEPGGYFRKRGWFPDTLGIVVPSGEPVRPAPRQLFESSLRRGLRLMRQKSARGRYATGTAAFDAWKEALLCDETFHRSSPERLRELHQVHDGAVGGVAEYRCYAADFVEWAAEEYPWARDELRQAAGCFRVQHDLMWRVWEQLGGHPEYSGLEEEPSLAFARPDVRGRIVDVLRQARQRDAEASEHLEAALRLVDEGQTTSAAPARRAVLEGVPYVGFETSRTSGEKRGTWVCAATHAALHYLRDPHSYSFLMGVSGAAFRLAWNAERWDGGNISTLNIGEDPTEHIRRAFRAVGWVPAILGNPQWRDGLPAEAPTGTYRGPDYLGPNVEYQGEAALRERVCHDLRFKRYPLISIGTVFPPECGLITGYDDGGDVIIGWHHFQGFPENTESGKVSLEPDGRFRKRDWYPDTIGVVAFDYKTARPSLADTYRNAIEWAVTLGRTPRFRQHYSGLAAYEAWAAALADGRRFEELDDEARFAPLMCQNDAMNTIIEGRTNAAEFLRDAARTLSSAAPALEAAAGAYEAEVRTVLEMADRLGGVRWHEEPAALLADAGVRARLVALIDRARLQEEEALSSLERALHG